MLTKKYMPDAVIVAKSKHYAINCHNSTRHFYDGNNYEVHLNHVVEVAFRYLYLLDEEEWPDVISGCWVHDVIDDCRQTYNDVRSATNERIAELAYALTNEKGKNRAERGNDKYYEGIKAVKHAPFIKVCDRIANFEYSISVKSRMADMYRKENPEFIKKIEGHAPKEMLDYLKSI